MKIRNVLLASLIVILQGCISQQAYNTTPTPIRLFDDNTAVAPALDLSPMPCASPELCVAFAEYDEFGRPFNRGQVDATVSLANEVAEKNGVIVVYVHGWHHNASKGDENLENLTSALRSASIHQRSDKRSSAPILGIYVGWRGESIDSDAWYGAPFSYGLTFWGRKSSAHDVANGAVLELFSRLTAIRRTHKNSRLVIIGHSFGAAVVASSISHKLTEQLVHVSSPVDKADGKESSPSWDLAILVNPAFEALRLRTQFELAATKEYPDPQPIYLIIITTKADWATHYAFPVGRSFSTAFDSYAEGDSQGGPMNRTAIGHYIPFVTHQLQVSSKCQTEALLENSSLLTLANDKSFCFNKKYGNDEAKPLFLTRCDTPDDCDKVAAGHYITRGAVANGRVPYRLPIMNIRTTGDVMSGHTDIWKPTMKSLVTQMVILGANSGTFPSK